MRQPRRGVLHLAWVGSRHRRLQHRVQGRDGSHLWPCLPAGASAQAVNGADLAQEFVDARRQPAIQGAPQVLYSNREPPLEIRHLPGLSSAEDVGYVTFGTLRSASLVSRPSAVPSPLQHARPSVEHHLAHPALPRLPALPHQVLESASAVFGCADASGVHALAHAASRRRVPQSAQSGQA